MTARAVILTDLPALEYLAYFAVEAEP